MSPSERAELVAFLRKIQNEIAAAHYCVTSCDCPSLKIGAALSALREDLANIVVTLDAEPLLLTPEGKR